MWSDADHLSSIPELDQLLDDVSNGDQALSFQEGTLATEHLHQRSVGLECQVELIKIGDKISECWTAVESSQNPSAMLLHHLFEI